jgi:hypothetical protein
MVSFDTTGSMASCIEEVREKVGHLVTRMFGKVPNLRVGIIAHGDYCDAGHTYVTKMLDLTNNASRIQS